MVVHVACFCDSLLLTMVNVGAFQILKYDYTSYFWCLRKIQFVDEFISKGLAVWNFLVVHVCFNFSVLLCVGGGVGGQIHKNNEQISNES